MAGQAFGWVLSGWVFWLLVRAHRQKVLESREPSRIQNLPWTTSGMPTSIAATLIVGLLIAAYSVKDAIAADPSVGSKQSVRRDVADRHGNVIATSLPAFDLWLIPEQFWGTSLANPSSDAKRLTGQPSDELRRERLLQSLADWPHVRAIVEGRLDRYGKSEAGQKILAWGIKPEVAAKITAGGLSGLKLLPRPIRHYPQGSLFAHVLGFASLSDPTGGQEGLELAENQTLLLTEKDRIVPTNSTLQTTLDPELQRAATDALTEGISTHGANGGAAVVIEAATGKIRAMVSAPGFDANDISTYRNPYQPDRMLNRARGVNFPAGSLLTPLLAAHMIETGRMKPSTQIAIGNQLSIGKIVIADASPHETLSLTEIVTKSSNIGQAKLALALPLPELRDIICHLGVGMPLAIRGMTGNINYESIDWTQWTPQMQAQPGLYINTNLLQITRAYLPLANGGRLERIQLMEDRAATSPTAARVLSPATTKAVREILGVAAGLTGTAPLAQLPDVMVAGKTGTIVASDDSIVTAFIGMAPADKPRWLIGILLQFRPQHPRLAGSTAAPVFAQLLEKIIRAKEIT